jgi:hypothetical protein
VVAQAVQLLACSSAIRSGGRCRRSQSGRRRAARQSSVAPQAFPHGVGFVRTCGGGTGVPFVMALRMPVFLFIAAFGA